MVASGSLRRLLSDFDAATHDLMRDGAGETDLASLGALAGALAADVGRWRALVDRLEAAAAAQLDPHRALAVVIETVFDEVLSPAAWRVLSATVALGEEGVS